MPELPDVEVYVERLRDKVVGATFEGMRLASPFLLRTFDPKPQELAGKKVRAIRRVGKRVAIGVEGELWAVIHLMVAGRLKWSDQAKEKIPGKVGLAAFDFSARPVATTPTGTLLLTEASTKKRASLHLVRGEEAVLGLAAGGVEPLDLDLAGFKSALQKENHTLKRTLTDPRIFSGIGNSYSDEILHRAKLSPVQMSTKLKDDEVQRLYDAIQGTLRHWLDALRKEAMANGGWPDKVTAFREEMAVHGKYGKPCPVCGSPVQRITYAENETNYCATCQTNGKLLADRSLSRLMKSDWPKTLEELEERRTQLKG
ncbi:MAG: Fpg/Nei family DNA glycosylase [Polyangiales bacterium]